jgi:hypothetical protein
MALSNLCSTVWARAVPTTVRHARRAAMIVTHRLACGAGPAVFINMGFSPDSQPAAAMAASTSLSVVSPRSLVYQSLASL